jgi:hypothetical protein
MTSSRHQYIMPGPNRPHVGRRRTEFNTSVVAWFVSVLAFYISAEFPVTNWSRSTSRKKLNVFNLGDLHATECHLGARVDCERNSFTSRTFMTFEFLRDADFGDMWTRH